MFASSLVTFAGPLASAVSSASGMALRGVESAFDRVWSLGEGGASTKETPNASNPAPVDAVTQLKEQAEALRSQLDEAACARLAAEGVTLDRPLTLEADDLGGFRLTGSDPQASWIERTLQSDPTVTRLFNQLQSVERELASRRSRHELDRLYALDPEAARRQLEQSPLLAESPIRVTIGEPTPK